MSLYLIYFNAAQIAPQIVREKINGTVQVADWMSLGSDVVLVRTSESLAWVTTGMRAAFPTLQFLAVEIDPTRTDGWMPKPVWDFTRSSIVVPPLPKSFAT